MRNNMKLEKQVVSLELSKKLKKLGVKQESLFVWVLDPPLNKKKNMKLLHAPIKKWGIRLLYKEYSPTNNEYKFYPAFTVAELGEMLPWEILVKENKYRKSKVYHLDYCWLDGWLLSYEYLDERLGGENNVIGTKNEANSRAEMLIYLIKNKLLQVNSLPHPLKKGRL